MIFNPTELSHSPYTVCAEADNKLKQVESLAVLRWENQPKSDSLTNYQPEKELFVKPEKKGLHRPGIEPGPPAWQASILPLNQRCLIAVK